MVIFGSGMCRWLCGVKGGLLCGVWGGCGVGQQRRTGDFRVCVAAGSCGGQGLFPCGDVTALGPKSSIVAPNDT